MGEGGRGKEDSIGAGGGGVAAEERKAVCRALRERPRRPG